MEQTQIRNPSAASSPLLRRMCLAQSLVAVWFVLFVSSAFAAKTDVGEDEKPWVEAEVQFPGFPQEEGLIPFTVGAISDRQYFVDGSTISVGEDGVVRYILIVISSAGARNVSFEGMRCSTAERRSYAFGRPDGTWSSAKSNRWNKIQGSANNHFVELFSNYFCKIGAPAVTSGDDARRILRNGGVGRY